MHSPTPTEEHFSKNVQRVRAWQWTHQTPTRGTLSKDIVLQAADTPVSAKWRVIKIGWKCANPNCVRRTAAQLMLRFAE
jgi:hypothetical protein